MAVVARGAPGGFQLAVHVQQAAGAAALVQVIDILRDDQQLAPPFRIEPAERQVGGVGDNLGKPRPAGIVESLHQHGIAGEGLRRRYILHPVAFPQAIEPAEGGHAGFGGNARACQDDDPFRLHGRKSGRRRCLVQARLARAPALPEKQGMARDRLRIGVLGAGGRMGRALIAGIAASPDLALAGGVERPDHPACGTAVGDGLIVCANAGPVAHKADVLIDFTSPGALAEHLRAAEEAGCALVVGTTGLAAEEERAIDRSARSIAILQAPNMALGVNLLAALVEKVAARLGSGWDIEILELHHRAKRDAPSGTALHLAEAAAKGRKVPLAEVRLPPHDGPDAIRPAGGIGLASLRGGAAAGDHQVMFLGPGERLLLAHMAEGREIFATGALAAARWLAGRPAGRYRMAELLDL